MSQTATTSAGPASSVAAVEGAIRGADPWAFPVASRIVRRVIRHAIDLPGLNPRVPHRKSLVIAAAAARPIVANDELGLEPNAALPETLILLARPEEHEREQMTSAALVEHYRRLHFHARIHIALDERLSRRELDERGVRERIERIGTAAFDEIREVLAHEAFFMPQTSILSAYVEFAAVFLELRYFAPDVLATYFPSLDDFNRVEAILLEDVDADAILEMTADLAATESGRPGSRDPIREARVAPPAGRGPQTERAFQRMLRDGVAAAKRGNDVRAAILHARAAAYQPVEIGEGEAPAEPSAGVLRPFAARQEPRPPLRSNTSTPSDPDPRLAETLADVDIRRLAGRLGRALSLEPRVVEALRELLSALLAKSAYGFWNPDARLLYDLQKVCLDAERESYVIDLGACLLSLGKKPLKRPLPAEREVLISKHLRAAAGRLSKVQIAAGQREHLSILLRESAVWAEHRLRERLRPALEEAMIEVGFLPANLPERVALRKIVEELLDDVVKRGFFAMGDLRDAVARNNLKLDDVADPVELIAGDRLLRADRRLADALDGVYQRGALYLRLLQRISSCAFGTRWGRFLTLYVVIPFGGAFVLLSFFDHLIHAIERLTRSSAAAAAAKAAAQSAAQEGHPAHEAHLTKPYLIVLVGVCLLGLIHNQPFRGAVWSGLRGIGRFLRTAVVEFPQWLADVTLFTRLLRSPPAVFFRKRLLSALVLTAFFCRLLPALGCYEMPTVNTTAFVFLVWAMLLNSRVGRDIEELTAERAQLMWHRIRVHVFVALFDLVMDSFKRVLEGVERVLYEVDEWLRFKSGETGLTLAAKAVLGLVWSIVRFFVQFFVAVLVEPQLNPIKHFPVVTVSHKIIFPMQFPLARSLVPVLGGGLAITTAATTVLLLPGVFGFLVWELRGNWRLYAVNRHRDLKPVAIGAHGETLLRLLKFGLHSGTLPRLFARLRRSARRANPAGRLRRLMGYYARLHHVEIDVRRFFEREFVGFLAESQSFRGIPMAVGRTEAGTNSIRVEIRAPQIGEEPLWIAFEEHSGRIVAEVWRIGWLRELTPARRAVVDGLLVGFYRIAGVDLVREQVLACLGPAARPYDVGDAGLVLLPAATRQAEVVYDLDEFPEIIPRSGTNGASSIEAPIDAKALVFGRTKTSWQNWVAAWALEEAGEPFPDLSRGDAAAD